MPEVETKGSRSARTSSEKVVEPKGGDPSSAPKKAPAPAVPPMDKEKKKALDLTLSQIEKTFGKGAIMKMDEDAYLAVPGISTGSLSLDLALGGKGIPRGRIVEIFGPESSGKTTLALTVEIGRAHV